MSGQGYVYVKKEGGTRGKDYEVAFFCYYRRSKVGKAWFLEVNNAEKHFEVHGIIVSEKHERRGVGRALMNMGMSLANRMTTCSTPSAIGFYKSLGFKELGKCDDGGTLYSNNIKMEWKRK